MSDILSHIPLSGQYLYVESSEPRAVGDKAVLVSGIFKGLQCMRFMYHMHGQDIGSLSVYRFGDGIMRSLFWRRHGDQGDKWHEARITFPCNSTSYQVTMPYKVACRSIWIWVIFLLPPLPTTSELFSTLCIYIVVLSAGFSQPLLKRYLFIVCWRFLRINFVTVQGWPKLLRSVWS